jgi:hypothetical protein
VIFCLFDGTDHEEERVPGREQLNLYRGLDSDGLLASTDFYDWLLTYNTFVAMG